MNNVIPEQFFIQNALNNKQYGVAANMMIDLYNKNKLAAQYVMDDVATHDSHHLLLNALLDKKAYEVINNFFKHVLDKPLDNSSYNIIGSYYYLCAGNFYYNSGNYKDSLEAYEKALGFRIKTLGMRHVDVARSYNKIGMSHYNLGEYNKALEAYSQALDIRKKMLGENHVTVKNSYNEIESCKQPKTLETFKGRCHFK